MESIKEKILNNKITRQMLKTRGIETDEAIEDFLFPSLKQVSDPFSYIGVAECVERIKKAVDGKEKVLICGDYDTDGLCASYIIYSYLKSVGVDVEVNIPSRVDDGYGINLGYILDMQVKPNLVITVDCGISCADEIEKIKKSGIDVLVTDHHNIPEKTPDCVVFDPKQDKELFNGFCGAGVALKLVQALGGDAEFEKYIDIAGIATIGDIVPLIGENRVIVKFGLDKLNNNPQKNLKLLLNYLGMESLTSTDVSFRLVPFLNSAGRVGDVNKAFAMLTEEDEINALMFVDEVNTFNKNRLKYLEDSQEELSRLVGELDLNTCNCLMLKSVHFHEGVIGILASMLSNKYKRAVMVFSDKDGELKGSGRSYGEFNLHDCVMKYSYLCEKIGGHDYACGLTIKTENFEEFSNLVNSDMQNVQFCEPKSYELELEVEDINDELFSMISMFEPFGLGNDKPRFMIMAQKMSHNYLSIKSHKHYTLNVDGVKIVAFNATKYLQTFDSDEIKELIVELNINRFNNKNHNQVVLKDVKTKDVFKIKDDEEDILSNEILSLFMLINEDSYDVVELDFSSLVDIIEETENFGSVFVARRDSELKQIKSILKELNLQLPVQFLPTPNTQSLVCVNNSLDLNLYKDFKRIIYLSKPQFDINFKAKENQEIYVFVDEEGEDYRKDFELSRSDFANIFSILNKIIIDNKSFDDVMDMVEHIKNMQNVYAKSEIMLILCVFLENCYVKLENYENSKIRLIKGETQKKELSCSKIYQMVFGE